MNTRSVEDYLKAIFELRHGLDPVGTTSLAERLLVKPASVTGMIKKLADMRLVVHEPYRGVRLTDAGRSIALEVIRHHRLVEAYLADALGVPWDEVHAEAEKWEHVLSEKIEDRMDEALGYPTTDPHGSPIPTRDGRVPRSEAVRLTDLGRGLSAVVTEVSDRNPELLRRLAVLGLVPHTEVRVESAPLEGPLTVRVGGVERVVGRADADHVFVTASADIREERCTPTGGMTVQRISS